jgi:hypothetical protein
MKSFAIAIICAAAAMAVPTGNDGSGTVAYKPCTSPLFSNVQCCATDVLGVVGLNCQNRESFILSTTFVGPSRIANVSRISFQAAH